MSRPPRVLCYAPYNRWALHGQWETTILHALRHRGAEVQHVLCDGLYSDCDVFWAATEPRTPRSCAQCQAEVTSLAHGLADDFVWLGRYLDPRERRTAQGWADALPAAELDRATLGDWEIGAWVRASVQSHLRSSRLDLADPRVAEAYRSYVFSGAVAAFALDRLLDDFAPDVLFMFNGRQSSTRVAFELARRRGIRVVCHERGARHQTLQLTEDATCTSLDPYPRLWEAWGEVPLDAAELDAIVTHMGEREHGLGLSWRSFTAGPQAAAAVRAGLGLAEDRPTWVLYTTSDDEVAGDPEWDGRFGDQLEWIRRTVAYAAAHPSLDLVIRVHPNTGSRRSTGANGRQLAQLEALKADLPANARIVDPDDEVSSYTLMELATVGLVWQSSVALEIACRGKATVVAAGNVVQGLPFVHTVTDPDGYEALLDELRRNVATAAVDPEVRRLAHRFAYAYLYRFFVDFPLVAMPTPHLGRTTWSDPAELVPGRHPELDRCAAIVLGDAPVCAPPDAAARGRGDAAELAAFFADPARAFTALAFAEELIADAGLLRGWGEAFDAASEATLVIQTPPSALERLVEAVATAGLEGDGAPDLMAIDTDVAALGTVDALYSRRPSSATDAPRFDDTTTAALRSLAGRLAAPG